MSNWRPPGAMRIDDMQGVTASRGTPVTAGSSAHTKGASVAIGSPSYDWDGFWLTWDYNGGGYDTITDLSLDSGATNLIVSNFYLPMSWNNGNNGGGTVSFPIPVQVGATIYCRMQSGGGGQTTGFSLVGYKGSWGFPQRFSKAVGIGNNLGTTASAQIVGPSGTWGSFAQIVASTADHYAGFLVSPDNNKNSNAPTAQDWTLTLAVGAAGSEKTLAILRGAFSGVIYEVRPSTWGTILVDVPSGTRLSAKGDASTTTTPGNQLGLSICGLVA